jgi:hypothetical protein
MAQVLASGMALKAANNLLPVAADVAQGVAGGVGGAIGSIFGKKAGRVGKKIGKGIAGFGRKLLGFNSGGVVVGGGKVRITPVKIRGGYVMGGQVVPAKPKRSRRKK